MVADNERVPDNFIIPKNIEETSGNKASNIKKQGFKTPLKNDLPEDKRPGVIIDLRKVPEDIKQIDLGKGITEALVIVEGEDGVEKPKKFTSFPIVRDDLPVDDWNLFKDPARITIIPLAQLRRSLVVTLTVKIHVCGRYQYDRNVVTHICSISVRLNRLKGKYVFFTKCDY